MADEKLVATLRLLFANYKNDYDSCLKIGEALEKALGDRTFVVGREMLERQHCYCAYWISPEVFTERLESNDEVFTGDRAELEKAAQDAWSNIPDGIYETMGYHIDDYIDKWREKGLVVAKETAHSQNATG